MNHSWLNFVANQVELSVDASQLVEPAMSPQSGSEFVEKSGKGILIE